MVGWYSIYHVGNNNCGGSGDGPHLINSSFEVQRQCVKLLLYYLVIVKDATTALRKKLKRERERERQVAVPVTVQF